MIYGINDNWMTTKQLNRKIRVLRLLAVTQAYHYYTMMQMNRQLLQCGNNSWQEAERLCYWFNAMIPYIEHSPTDFLHDKDEVTDTAINNYDKFKEWTKIAEGVGISEKILIAFCKNVDNAQSVIRLKALGHLMYPEWLTALFLYLNNAISKIELQNTFVEYSLFSGKAKPANLAEFRKTVFEIENKILQIAGKQLHRSVKNNIHKKCSSINN